MNFNKMFSGLAAFLTNGQAGGHSLPNNPRLFYRDGGRSGHILFQNNVTNFTLYWEFGGGDTLAFIDVPEPEEWTEKTKLPAEERERTLRFIAERVIRDKTSGNHRYEVTNSWINIFM